MEIYNIDNRLKPMISVFLGEQIKLNPKLFKIVTR